ncbi:DUF6124 family protein [Pseudomonas sp. PD9R]|uniref:DUF6124 family protein n=1 Tax=Pseudomonas sp. PD9R TaxID=2853534 RepID=UPI001C4896C9|nr:DUF6124 family protein [Pseudomonas sp. PD9R]MBV6824912.1 hypothetical protein [Pseudomonas sp. PD9R]
MSKVTDIPAGSEVESTAPYVSTPSKKLHHAVNRALDHYLKPSVSDVPHAPSSIFVVAPDINNETLLAYACESLASASVLANEFSGTLDGAHRNTMLALQQVIMLGELAVSRVLDNIGTPQRV